MDWLKGKKTLLANGLVIIVAALGGLENTVWAPSPEVMAYVLGLANMLLRLITTGPITVGVRS